MFLKLKVISSQWQHPKDISSQQKVTKETNIRAKDPKERVGSNLVEMDYLSRSLILIWYRYSNSDHEVQGGIVKEGVREVW